MCFPGRKNQTDRSGELWRERGRERQGGLPAQMPNTKDRLTIVDVALAAGNCNY